MTLDDLKQMQFFITRGIGEAVRNAETHDYIGACLRRFLAGDWGDCDDADKAANNADLEAGEGHILADYPQFGALRSKVCIEAHFCKDYNLNDINYNNICVMYPNER